MNCGTSVDGLPWVVRAAARSVAVSIFSARISRRVLSMCPFLYLGLAFNSFFMQSSDVRAAFRAV